MKRCMQWRCLQFSSLPSFFFSFLLLKVNHTSYQRMKHKFSFLTGILFFSLFLSFVQVATYHTWLMNNIDQRSIESGTTSTLNSNSSGSSKEGSKWRWKGTSCGHGSFLSNKKLVKYCKDPAHVSMPVFPSFCKRILEDREPPCGFFVSGKLDPPLSVIPLAGLRPLLGDEGSACAFPATYNGPQSNATITLSDIGDFPGDFALRPAACPDYRYFTPLEAVSILYHASIGRSGHGILVTGDSMTRQLFLRIMFYLRGESFFAEHYFHVDALYVVYEDRDELVIRPTCAQRALVERYFPGFPMSSLKGSPCGPAEPINGRVILIFLYLWDETPRTFRKEPFAMGTPPVHMASFNYWWRKGLDRPEDIVGYMDRLGEKMLRTNPNYMTQYVFFTTPWSSANISHVLPEGARVVRNAEAWKLLRALSQPKNVSISLVDFSALADVRHVGRTMDRLHYMCIWLPEHPQTITKQKYNQNDCRDPVNLAIVQWVLHLFLTNL